jgi:hypothetical protein
MPHWSLHQDGPIGARGLWRSRHNVGCKCTTGLRFFFAGHPFFFSSGAASGHLTPPTFRSFTGGVWQFTGRNCVNSQAVLHHSWALFFAKVCRLSGDRDTMYWWPIRVFVGTERDHGFTSVPRVAVRRPSAGVELLFGLFYQHSYRSGWVVMT